MGVNRIIMFQFFFSIAVPDIVLADFTIDVMLLYMIENKHQDEPHLVLPITQYLSNTLIFLSYKIYGIDNFSLCMYQNPVAM
jgi:hypothetical protein